jgi:eukaryotic-like serine/threonine-protein kinase
MNPLGDVPTDVLFGLIALNNDLVASEVIPAALRARALEPTRPLAEHLVTQGAMTSTQRDLVETLCSEYINRHGGDAEKSVATLIATPSARERLDQLVELGLTDDGAHAFSLGSTVSFSPDDPESTLLPPTNGKVDSWPRIAGYEIIELLGVGGMGIVYKARQERLDRFVALKMIRAGAGARPEDLVRFETEAKAVAAIEHSNIVKIFEIGEQHDTPYFSLEYLAGGSLAKQIGGKPQPVDEAARIVEVLARAIAVAHAHRVIHRDLKPANVLVAADGTLKISDFGLVKRLENDSGQTRSGSILGTPSYMAPEQARGESQHVGPAADQYSLGAILYELLTGRPPFQGRTVVETLDLVRTTEPVAPTQLQPKTPRDLETICLKCLQKEIPRRYPDVLALAEDLRRFRAGEPILARPVSDTERLWRWCLRNRRVASLSAAVALLLVIVTAGSAIAAVTLGKANTVAEQRRLEAERKQKLAVDAARAANEQNRHAVDADVNLVRLLDGKLRYVPAIQNEREDLLDKAIARLKAGIQAMTDLRRDVEWAPKDEEHNWRSLAKAYQAQAKVNLGRNKVQDAMGQFRQSEEIIKRLAEANPEDLDMQVILLRTQRELGHVSMDRVGDSEAAQRYFQKALDTSRACLAKKPDGDVYKSELANSLGLLAGSEMKLGHLTKAHELYYEEVKVRESFSPAQANVWESRRELASLYAQLAELNVRLGDRHEAGELHNKCDLLREQAAKERPDSWPAQHDLGLSYNNHGYMHYPQGDDAAAAREWHKKALTVFKKWASANPGDLENKHSLAQTLYYEATCALNSGDKVGAAAGFRDCLKICQELDIDPKAKVPKTLLMLALARCGDHARATEIAFSLVATHPKDEGLYVQSACGYALAASAVGGDADHVKTYKDRAIECLREAIKRGWADAESLEIDTDLVAIRTDPEFKTLLDELRQKRGARP